MMGGGERPELDRRIGTEVPRLERRCVMPPWYHLNFRVSHYKKMSNSVIRTGLNAFAMISRQVPAEYIVGVM
jgi:hypothetical protein